jgi:RNA polymerase sigma-70 factor (ECF subfamily)
MSEKYNLSEGSDEWLIEATLRGDISCFGRMVERYWAMAVAMALSRIDDAAEAEDVAQESFIKAYQELGRLRDPSRFAGWLSRIIGQQCTNLVRRKVRRKLLSSRGSGALDRLDWVAAPTANPGLSVEQTHVVRRTVRRLPEKFRKVIIMRFVGGLSAGQIAVQLGKRHGTVRVWLHRAYQILRKELAPLIEEVQ